MKRRTFPPQAPESILVIATRRIGDVILTTPLIRSLCHAYPDARLDVVVFKGTENCISANKDIDAIITIAEGAPFREQIKTICTLFRRYDLAISTLPGDRPTFYSLIAGKISVGFVEKGRKLSWQRLLLDKYVLFDNRETHTVTMNLSLLKPLDVRPLLEVTISWAGEDEVQVNKLLPFDIAGEPYAVLHVYPMFSYKRWHDAGWEDLVRWLDAKGLRTVLTGSNSPEEREYVARLCRSLPYNSINVAGALSLSGVAYLLSKASVYIGLDTSVTHMASALGIPTIAMYGPTNPVKWGPMPKETSFSGKSPYERKGSQKIGNVFLLQGRGECVPCHEEGCDRNIESLSRCLQDIPAADVIEAVETMLTRNR